MARKIFTIGYQQATQPAVLAALEEAGVEVLADVRARPLSRKPGFSKSALKAAVEGAMADGMSLAEMQEAILLEDYADWVNYDRLRRDNIEAAYLNLMRFR